MGKQKRAAWETGRLFYCFNGASSRLDSLGHAPSSVTSFGSGGVVSGILSGASGEFIGRTASKNAVQLHFKLYPAHVCPYNGGEWHSDMVAFRSGRADRMYTFGSGAASAYQIKAGQARLVWCGQTTESPASGWHPRSNVLRALVCPLRTVAGTLPNEGALDVFAGFAGRLITKKLTAAGKVTCTRERFDKREFRTSWQFGADDTCP